MTAIDRMEEISRQRERIDRLNPAYHAFSHLAPWDGALQPFLAERRGLPLAGLSASVKGNIPVAGLPYTEGTAIHAGRIAAADAGIVRRARQAGAYIHGTTTLSELAMYGVRNDFETMGLNPWNIERTAGGSSTGAGVAAALGLADINIGTDAGGSIRNPACHCGAVGFMPRIGALTGEGKANYSPSVSTVGLIASSTALMEKAYSALSDDSSAAEIRKRVLVPYKFIEEMSDAATLVLFCTALERLEQAGIELVAHEFINWRAAEAAAGVASLAECAGALAAMDLSKAGEGIRRRAASAARLTPEQIEQAQTARKAFRQELNEAVDASGADAVVTPTWPFAAPLIDAEEIDVQGRLVPLDPHRNCFVRVANAVDACALTVPMGLYETEAVPAGLHLMAPGGRERSLLALGALAEEAMPKLPAPPPLLRA